MKRRFILDKNKNTEHSTKKKKINKIKYNIERI